MNPAVYTIKTQDAKYNKSLPAQFFVLTLDTDSA